MPLSVRFLILVALALAGCMKNEERPSAQSDFLIVWYPSGECKPTPDDGSPGSSPDNPIIIPTVEELAFEVFDDGEWNQKIWKPNRNECRWISIVGFMKWADYYHYRGTLTSGVPELWRHGDPFLWIENFQDTSIRRADVARRWVRITGLYYDLCQSARIAEEADGEEWVMLFGPCHYGNDNGMMLKDAIIEEIEAGGPRYLRGEGDRSYIGDMFPLGGTDRPAIESAIRQWFREVQRGPAAFAEMRASAMSRETYASQRDVEDVRRFYASPDSYVSYLYGLEAVRAIDPSRAQIGVFVASDFNTLERDDYLRAIGCVCLTGNCSDIWPLRWDDADNFLGGAACASLRYNPEADRWDVD